MKGLTRITEVQSRLMAQQAIDELQPYLPNGQYEPTHILPCYCAHRRGFKRGQCVTCGLFEHQLQDQVKIHLEYVSREN